MTKRMRILRSDLICKVATVTLTAGFLAGCSGAVERFGEAPVYTGGTDNQRSILAGGERQPSFDEIVNGPGGTVAGLPPASSAPVTTGSIPSRSSSSPSGIETAQLPAIKPSTAPARQQGAAAARPATAAAPPVTWKGWSSAGGTRVPVRAGDTLSSLSRRYGVPVQAVAAVNGISDPSRVRTGQTLVIPTYVYSSDNGTTSATAGESGPVRLPAAGSSAPLTTASLPARTAANTAAPARKPVRQPTFAEVSSGQLPAAATSAAPTRLSALPKSKPRGAARQAPLTTASIGNSVPVPQKQPVRTISTTPQPASDPAADAEQREARPTQPIERPQIVASTDTQATEADGPQFRWPVRGRIISDFGPRPGGTRNDGINLAVPEGTPVKATDAGTVIYSGNELKGYGNLVLLRHDDGWVSAYAHNSELKVKRGDTVRRGDVVGLAGATGSVTQPQVHFELRRGNKPVDPLKHLPRN
ncbi:MAG: peptidoglycan DD-metalloendopeptidase family protein [Roseibium sp.]|nr:peptidoglycan DD-metalloendopeptidase family protein [Roseibium sp.]